MLPLTRRDLIQLGLASSVGWALELAPRPIQATQAFMSNFSTWQLARKSGGEPDSPRSNRKPTWNSFRKSCSRR